MTLVRNSVFDDTVRTSSVTNGFALLATRQLQSHWIYIVQEARKPKSGSNGSQAGTQAPSRSEQKYPNIPNTPIPRRDA